MKTHIVNLVKRISKYLAKNSLLCRILIPIAFGFKGYLLEEGWFKSYSKMFPVDNENSPIPWFTYPFIEFIEPRIRKDMIILEFGTGNSTLWWSSKVKRVKTCEHDRTWYQHMIKKIPVNVELYLRELEHPKGYFEFAAEYKEFFDIIVIDGRERVNCILNSLGALKKDGIFIIDNSELEKYSVGIEFLKSKGFKEIGFTGIGPLSTNKWTTSVFYRHTNCLNL